MIQRTEHACMHAFSEESGRHQANRSHSFPRSLQPNVTWPDDLKAKGLGALFIDFKSLGSDLQEAKSGWVRHPDPFLVPPPLHDGS